VNSLRRDCSPWWGEVIGRDARRRGPTNAADVVSSLRCPDRGRAAVRLVYTRGIATVTKRRKRCVQGGAGRSRRGPAGQRCRRIAQARTEAHRRERR
jgi:hypothetical protein